MLLGLCLLAGCASTPDTKSVPKDFAFEYKWIAGTMPPPYHYEFLVAMDASGSGTITFWPNYPGRDSKPWVEKFAVTPENRERIYRRMQETAVFGQAWRKVENPPIGGSYDWVDVTANGKKYDLPAFPVEREKAKALYKDLVALAPQSLWDDLYARRKKFEEEYKKE